MAIGGGKETEILVLGVDPDYQQVRRIIVSAGRFFDQQDSQSGNKVALITESLAKRQFGGLDLALGQTIKVQDSPLRHHRHFPRKRGHLWPLGDRGRHGS